MAGRTVRIAAVQFESSDRDKGGNLQTMERLAKEAVKKSGANLVCFHEACITGVSPRFSTHATPFYGSMAKGHSFLPVEHLRMYSFLQTLSFEEILGLGEPVPGPSTSALGKIARNLGVAIGAGLVEVARPTKSASPRIYNSYVVVDSKGKQVACHRKLQPFVSTHLSPGDNFCVFPLLGFTFGILICYDNNLPENVRCTTLRGAEIILMPHVTGGSASNQPGRGTIDRALWDNRERDPASLQRQFRGLKGREWIHRLITCRSWENGVYSVFTNAVGVDHDTIKPGNSMVVDPCGNVVAECTELGDAYVCATISDEALAIGSGQRYLKARRPGLYGDLVAPSKEPSETRPCWTRSWESGNTTAVPPASKQASAVAKPKSTETEPLPELPPESPPPSGRTIEDRVLARGGRAIREVCGAPGLLDGTVKWIITELQGDIDVGDVGTQKRFADFTGVVQVLMKPKLLAEIRQVVLTQLKLVETGGGSAPREYAW